MSIEIYLVALYVRAFIKSILIHSGNLFCKIIGSNLSPKGKAILKEFFFKMCILNMVFFFFSAIQTQYLPQSLYFQFTEISLLLSNKYEKVCFQSNSVSPIIEKIISSFGFNNLSFKIACPIYNYFLNCIFRKFIISSTASGF